MYGFHYLLKIKSINFRTRFYYFANYANNVHNVSTPTKAHPILLVLNTSNDQ